MNNGQSRFPNTTTKNSRNVLPSALKSSGLKKGPMVNQHAPVSTRAMAKEMAVKSLAKLGVDKVVARYARLQKEALEALKSRLPNTPTQHHLNIDQKSMLRLSEEVKNRINATVATYIPMIEAELRSTLHAEAMQHIRKLRAQ